MKMYLKKNWIIVFLFIVLLTGCDSKVVLKDGINENNANDILSELSIAGIEAIKQSEKGIYSVYVNYEDLDKSLLILKNSGVPRQEKRGLGKTFVKEGMISSELEEKARYIYALSQDVEKTLEEIDGVIVARVHIVLPERIAPGEPLLTPSASVFIKHKPDVNPVMMESRVRKLVSSSIPGLTRATDATLSVVFFTGSVDYPDTAS